MSIYPGVGAACRAGSLIGQGEIADDHRRERAEESAGSAANASLAAFGPMTACRCAGAALLNPAGGVAGQPMTSSTLAVLAVVTSTSPSGCAGAVSVGAFPTARRRRRPGILRRYRGGIARLGPQVPAGQEVRPGCDFGP